MSSDDFDSSPSPTTKEHAPLFVAPLPASQRGFCFRALFVGLLIAVVVGVVVGVAVGLTTRGLPADPLERAKVLMSQNILIDTHNDLPWAFRDLVKDRVFSGTINLEIGSNRTMTDIPRLKKGLVGGQIWSVFVDCKYANKDAVRATQEQIDTVVQMTERYPSFFRMARSTSDIRELYRQGYFPSLSGMEGGHQIDSSLASLRSFYRAGVRYLTLTHNCDTPWSTSCCATNNSMPTTGLSSFGIDVVREMNRLGMMVDLSHTSVQTMRDAIDASSAPVIFSHACVYSICPHRRNVPDEILQKLKINGDFVNCSAPASMTTIDQVANHFVYVKNLIGAEHLCIGADFDGISSTIPGLSDVSDYPALIASLVKKGFTDDEIVGVLGGNILRVMEKAEQVSRSMSNIPPGQAVLTNISGNDCRTVY